MNIAARLLAPLALALPLALAPMIASAAPPPAVGPAIAMARIGETVRVHGLRVTPLRVIEDSRCPQNARCIWAGRVRLSVRIGRITRELTLGQPVTVAGGKLSLAAVSPERTTTRERAIPPRAYRFGFQFERASELELIRN